MLKSLKVDLSRDTMERKNYLGMIVMTNYQPIRKLKCNERRKILNNA